MEMQTSIRTCLMKIMMILASTPASMAITNELKKALRRLRAICLAVDPST